MKQATLIVLSDSFVKDKTWELLCHQLPLLDMSAIASEFETHKELFYDYPTETRQSMELIEKHTQHFALFCFNGIRIELCRHLVRCHVDVPYRTWEDYEVFRIMLNRFLSTLLRPLQAQNLLFFPSRWEQPFGTVKNEWHAKRLQQLQTKITQEAVSFKRTLQHLQHCLGTPQQRYWLLSFFDIDSGQLSVWAELKQTANVATLTEMAKNAKANIRFQCHDAWRNNSCPYRNFMGTGKDIDTYNRTNADESTHTCKDTTVKKVLPDGDRTDKKSCRLLPYTGNLANPTTFMEKNGYVCWNKYCFFTLYLYPDHLQIIFSRPANILMRPENRKECMQFIATLLSYFSIRKAWAGSAETFETAEQTAGSKHMEDYLRERHLLYEEANFIQSWREDILVL